MVKIATWLLLAIPGVWAADPDQIKFRGVDVDTEVQIGYGVTVADINGDKKPDLVLAEKALIAWYENPGWQKHIIARKLTEHDHVCVAAADIDGDGKAEIAVGAGWNPGDTVNSGAVFYLIPPADRTQLWEPVKLPHEPTVHRMRWVPGASGSHQLVVVPLHGKGNNPGSGEGEGVRVLVYHRPLDPRGTWSTDLVDGSLHKVHNFDTVQWDDDPDQELLVASKEGISLINRIPGGFGRQLVAISEAGGAGEVRSGKLPNGKRYLAAVEPMHGNQVAVYLLNAQKAWQRQVIDDTIMDGHAVACGDILNAGYDQLIVGWRAMNKPGAKVGIKLYRPVDQEGKAWKHVVVDDNTMACEDLCLADLNGDQRLDIIAAGRATKNLKIYLNLGEK